MGSAPLASARTLGSREWECGPSTTQRCRQVLLEALNEGDVVNSIFARFGDDPGRVTGNFEVS
jgi:hypothetical protein